MSYSNYFKPIQKTAYSYIGGVNDKSEISDDNEYIKNQTNLIRSQNQPSMSSVPDYINKTPHDNIIGSLRYGVTLPNNVNNIVPEDNYHKFNPYHNYLRNEGLFKETSKTRINTLVYTINSSTRPILPQISTTNEILLDMNALSFNSVDISIGVNNTTQDVLTITCPDHPIQKGDRITLSGLDKTSVSIKNIYQDVNGETKNAVVFTNFSSSAVFYCNFDTVINDHAGDPTSKIDTSMSFDPNFRIGTGISFKDLQLYDTSDMFVTISGFDISQIGTPFVGNIPINFLNSTHRVYFTNPDFKVVNSVNIFTPDTLINIPDNSGNVTKITGFYIKLPFQYFGTQSMNIMTLTLQFRYIGGIPINMINAQFPIDENNFNGYHEVYSVTQNTINILLNKSTYYKKLTENGLNEVQIPFGGSDITISQIDNIIRGYSNPNNYIVELPNMIHNVVMVKMISMTFPNTSKVFGNSNGVKNTRLYWQNQDDGDFIYNIEVDSGNYSPGDLQKIIQEKVAVVQKKYSKNSSLRTSYINTNYMAVDINTNTNKVSISSFKVAVLVKPIQDISPEIPTVGDGDLSYTLTILQTFHGLLPGDTVTFAGFIATSGIPANILNTTHVVITIPTSDTYTIVLQNFNLLAGSRSGTGGGNAAKALVPSAFKLLFNYPDTMGEQLGFRKVGKESSITSFNTVVSNVDTYENEIIVTDMDGNKFVRDESGNITLLTGNSLKLSGYDYVLMVIRKFDNIINISSRESLKTYFAKINLRGLPGTMIYDDFICPPLTLYEPISLSSLDISFYTPDGLLYDFNGLDHNFTLEITYVEYVPNETGLVSTLAMF